MARQTKAERARHDRLVALRVVGLRMFEADGALCALERDLGKAGLTGATTREVQGWRDKLNGWQEKIGGAAWKPSTG